MQEKIQLIQLKDSEQNIEGENLIISRLNSPQSFDRFDINGIDLSSTNIWDFQRLEN